MRTLTYPYIGEEHPLVRHISSKSILSKKKMNEQKQDLDKLTDMLYMEYKREKAIFDEYLKYCSEINENTIDKNPHFKYNMRTINGREIITEAMKYYDYNLCFEQYMLENTNEHFIYSIELQNGKFYIGKITEIGLKSKIYLLSLTWWTTIFPPMANKIPTIYKNTNLTIDDYVIQYMKIFSIDDVRGGSFLETQLSPAKLSFLGVETLTQKQVVWINPGWR